MTLVTYTSRCTRLHLKLSTQRSRAMLLLPVKWPRLTGAIGTGLQRRHIAHGGQCHMKPVPDEMFIYKANL